MTINTIGPIDTCECDIVRDGACDMNDWRLFGQDWGRYDCTGAEDVCECDLDQDGYLTIEGLADFNVGIEGDNNILFSFDLTVMDATMASVLTLWDFDMGGGMDDAQTLSGYTLDGEHLPVDLATANVPIPAAAWLLGSGLTGLLAIRRRKANR